MAVYGRRGMLNLPGWNSTAAIVAELENLEGWWQPTLKISDCDRAVSLNLMQPDTSTDAQFENDMYKLDTIAGSVKELQRAMRTVRRRTRGKV